MWGNRRYGNFWSKREKQEESNLTVMGANPVWQQNSTKRWLLWWKHSQILHWKKYGNVWNFPFTNHRSAICCTKLDIALKKDGLCPGTRSERRKGEVETVVGATAANEQQFVGLLDESGINTDFTRLYGRGKGKSRVWDKTPLNTPRSTTLISSVRLDGEMICGYLVVS